jgi:hypothetical protein
MHSLWYTIVSGRMNSFFYCFVYVMFVMHELGYLILSLGLMEQIADFDC